ncbi:hypothetical protein KDW_10920 [Dictyobacter vulcani]|uniref:Glyoxalase-like domain-containing protein n=1 Tax=Dictyobacter vulcani TaxID=2607529 RepID=A0A5J4KKK5_9CHLR|nr:VOC family protein [Dictyobacter vulcani]GER86930.1 hypothetical protein KDW_10920 [Dictyobacter vulcani]
MLTALDHIIIGVNNLTHADRLFAEHLGLISSGGGNHPSGGTANRIIVIGDTYLELIAVRAPEEAQQSMLTRLAKGDGYLNCVLASDDIVSDSRAMFERGVKIIGPNQGSLKSADGSVRNWQRTDVERPDLTQHYPFIIQHDSSGEERQRRLAGGKIPPIHPLGVQSVLSATLATSELSEARQRFQHIYGLTPTTQSQQSTWGAELVSFPLANQQQRLELAAPVAGQQVELALEDTLATHVRNFGESLYRITLGVSNLAASQQYLDNHNVGYTALHVGQPTLWLHPKQTAGATIVLQEA